MSDSYKIKQKLNLDEDINKMRQEGYKMGEIKTLIKSVYKNTKAKIKKNLEIKSDILTPEKTSLI